MAKTTRFVLFMFTKHWSRILIPYTNIFIFEVTHHSSSSSLTFDLDLSDSSSSSPASFLFSPSKYSTWLRLPLSQRDHSKMAVPDGIRGEDEDEAALFEEEGVDFADDEDIDHFEIPVHLRPLVSAAESGNLDALRLALDNFDGNIDEPVEDGDTVLHLACLYGHLNCVQFLLERGANLEAKDEDGGIPLHDACAGGYMEIAQLLLNSANDPERVKRMLETVDMEGDSPLHHAARGEYANVVRLLLAYGASPTNSNLYGKTPAELADPGTEARSILEEATGALLGH